MAEPASASRLRSDLAGTSRPFVAEPEDAVVSGDPVAEAFARGFEDGRAAGRSEAEGELSAEHAAFAARAAETIARLAGLEETITRRHEGLLLDIALAAASRVARVRIEAGDPVVSRALREAMDSLPPAAGLKVRVNPADLAAVAAELAAEIDLGRAEAIADAGVDRGGCLVESSVGTIDATIGCAEETVAAAARGGAEPL